MNLTKSHLSTVILFLLVFGVSENLFAQNTPRNTNPGARYKEKHITKAGSRYSSATGTVKAENTGEATSGETNQKSGSAAKQEFMKNTGFPMGRPGYVLDYIVPIDKGGCDCVANMQWITIEAAKAQGKLE